MVAPTPVRLWLLALCLVGLSSRPGWACTTDIECASLGFRCRGQGFCSNGDCIYPNPLNCNDSNPCTVDRCDDNFGCLHDPFCPADASVCNGTETCALVLVSIDPPIRRPQCGRVPLDCNDGKACTLDSCLEPSGCRHVALNCDDGNLCTVDGCAEPGGCTHTPRDCDDGDPCTADDCLPGNGCRHVPITPCCESAADCPDQVCAVERQCVANRCTDGVAPDCDDGDPGTDDACDAGRGGCVHTPRGGGGSGTPCAGAGECPADADPCTVASCAAGRCTQQSLAGIEGLTCTCSRPMPDACAGQSPPPQVGRASKRACRIIGRLPGATAARAGRLVRRIGKQFARAERGARGATTRKRAPLTPSCATALGAAYADGVTRAKRLEEPR